MNVLVFIEEAFHHFWKQHPALLYSLMLLLGIEAALSWNAILLIPLLMLALPLLTAWEGVIRLLLGLGMFIVGFALVHSYYNLPSLTEEGVDGTAEIEITSLTSHTASFGKRWIYRGTIRHFELEDNTLFLGRNLPLTLSLPNNKETLRPPANQAYRVAGKLKTMAPGRYLLKVSKDTPWYPIESSWSSAELRFKAKQMVQDYIIDHIEDRRAANFLAGIATGDFDDRMLQLDFSRFGLQHILAISGFHFAIIASILSLVMRLIIGYHLSHIFLIFILTSYFVFLGCSPSIMRAWITITIALGGILLKRRGFALNSLGIAILAILLYDPLLAGHLGFQLSCITTAAILLIYPTSDLAMQEVITKRQLSEMIEMNSLNQHAYCLLTFFRRALSLTIAVNLIAVPVMLFYFHKFPVLSLLYNLFFPFMVSISMLLLIVGLIVGVVPPLSDLIHMVNSAYTRFTLDFTRSLPTHLDVYWHITPFAVEWLLVYLCLIFGAAVLWRHWWNQHRAEWQDIAFI